MAHASQTIGYWPALKKWKWTILGFVMAMAAVTYFAVPWYLGSKVTTVFVTKGNVVQTLVVSGTIANPNRVDISPQMTGVVTEVSAREGQFVTEGQPLIILDDRELRASFTQAIAAVGQSEMKLRQLREATLPSAQQTLNQTIASLKQAQSQFDRTSKLHGSRIVSDAALEGVVRDLAQANAAKNSAQLSLETMQPNGSDYTSAEQALGQAQANVRGVQAKLAYTIMRAPLTGTVITRAVEQGIVVQPGKVLMVLSPKGKSEVTVLIDEKNLSLVALGQSALVSADAFPDQSFPATLSYIQPSIDPNRGSVQVKLDVADPPKFLLQDMTVSVDIEVAKHSNVMLMPVNAVHDLLTKKPWVLKVVGNYAVRQDVMLGVKGVTEVEITSGVKIDEMLIPLSNVGIITGEKIRPLQPVVRP